MKNKALKIGLLCSVLLLIVFTTGCTATWISVLGASLPTMQVLAMAVLSFVAALAGKSVSPSVAAAIQKIGSDIQASFGNVKQLIDAWKADTTDTTIVGKISAELKLIISNLTGILGGVSITNPASQSKLTQLVGLAIAAVQAALALIPMFGVAGTEKVQLSDAHLKLLKAHEENFKDQYNLIISEKTGDSETDAALATLSPL